VSPDLARLLAEPTRAMEVPAQDLQRIVLELASHQTTVSLLHRTLVSRLFASSAVTANGQPGPSARDQSLTPKEAATRMGVTIPWLYRNHHRLPFAKKLSRKCLRFSQRGLETWLATKGSGQPWK
jgi:predicted DNA-binding transcriptional regulator AlpA